MSEAIPTPAGIDRTARPVFLVYTYREPELLARTISRVRPFPVYVHVDAKVDQAPFEDAVAAEDRGRVQFVAPRFRVNWAGYSQIRAIRTLVQGAMSTAADTDYLVMLSGQDYPIKRMDQLVAHLSAAGGRQFLRYFEITPADGSAEYLQQVDNRHHRDLRLFDRRTSRGARRARSAAIRVVDRLSRLLASPRRPEGMRMAFGPTHFAMTVDFARHLEGRVTPQIEQYFRTVFCPEEHFYQSLALNSPRAMETGGALPGGAEPFAGVGNHQYANLHLIDPTLVKVFTADDWDEVSSSDRFFLRKLESTRSADLLTRIDTDLLGVEAAPDGRARAAG